jgi:hypothetical protein
VTSATAAFVAGDVGKRITGLKIPAGAVIQTVVSPTEVITNPIPINTVAQTGMTLTIYRQLTGQSVTIGRDVGATGSMSFSWKNDTGTPVKALNPTVGISEKRAKPPVTSGADQYLLAPTLLTFAKSTATGPGGSGAQDATGITTGNIQQGSSGTDPFNLSVPAAQNEIDRIVIAPDLTGFFTINQNFGPIGLYKTAAISPDEGDYADDAAFRLAIKNAILNAPVTDSLFVSNGTAFKTAFGTAVFVQSAGAVPIATAEALLSAGLVVTGTRPNNGTSTNGSVDVNFGSASGVGLGNQNLSSMNVVSANTITQVSTITPDNKVLFAGGTAWGGSTQTGGPNPGAAIVSSPGPGVYSIGWAFSTRKSTNIVDTQALGVLYPEALVPDLTGISPATVAIIGAILGSALPVDTSRCGVIGLLGLFCSADENALGPDLAGICALF